MNETYDEVKSTEMGESLVEWTKEEKENSAAKYGCSILVEKATLDQVKDPSWPNDARLIRYTVDGVQHVDLTRCSKISKLFDMYYDKYGKGSIQSIDFGYGTVNPKLWGYKAPTEKKKRK